MDFVALNGGRVRDEQLQGRRLGTGDVGLTQFGWCPHLL
ncbi:hypothetical protein EBESD8_45690 [Rhodococcus aetherivorans]|nr:hypothetical protein EBESD8_45690 [Rhodococcus aetherivorans]